MIFQKTKNHYQSNSNQSKNEGTDINDIGLEYEDIGQIKHESFITLEKKEKKIRVLSSNHNIEKYGC